MRIENTDRFRNRYCEVCFKDGHAEFGFVIYIPNMSAKYNYHEVGWFLKPNNTTDASADVKLDFKTIEKINTMWQKGGRHDLHYCIQVMQKECKA